MTKTTTPPTTPSPTDMVDAAALAGEHQSKNDKHIFIVAVLNLTWQMAIVVLLPILGGYALDKKFDTVPLITIGGFVLATLGVTAVLWRQLQLFAPPKARVSRRQHS